MRATRRISPLRAVLGGALAGAFGTGAMDLVQYLQYRKGGGDQDFATWELSGVDSWEGAPAPAQLAKRVLEGVRQEELGPSAANPLNNVVHWGYGMAWGAANGVLRGASRPSLLGWGPLFGTGVWLTGYLVLPATGLYEPLSEYPWAVLAKDLAHHLVYGVTATAAYRLLSL